MDNFVFKKAKEISILTILQDFGIEYQKRGENYVSLCPLHNEKSGSFTIYANENFTRAQCFGACRKQYSSLDIYTGLTNRNLKPFEAAKEMLTKYANFQESDFAALNNGKKDDFKPVPSQAPNKIKKPIELPTPKTTHFAAFELFERKCKEWKKGKEPVYNYLKQDRGFTDNDTLKLLSDKFAFFAVPQCNEFLESFTLQEKQTMLECGVFAKNKETSLLYCVFKNYPLIYTYKVNDKITNFEGRAIYKTTQNKCRFLGNEYAEKTPYNVDSLTNKENDTVVICEGVIDLWTFYIMALQGFLDDINPLKTAFVSSGSANSYDKIAPYLLQNKHIKRVFVFADLDENGTGAKNADAFCEKISCTHSHLTRLEMCLPFEIFAKFGIKDANDFAVKHNDLSNSQWLEIMASRNPTLSTFQETFNLN